MARTRLRARAAFAESATEMRILHPDPCDRTPIIRSVTDPTTRSPGTAPAATDSLKMPTRGVRAGYLRGRIRRRGVPRAAGHSLGVRLRFLAGGRSPESGEDIDAARALPATGDVSCPEICPELPKSEVISAHLMSRSLAW